MKRDKKNDQKELDENQLPEDQEELDEESELSEKTEEIYEINAEKLVKLENEIAGLKDQLLRKAAEFENYKRRTENDQLNLIKYSAESFIIKLLPAVDDFERSLQHIENAKDSEAIKKGIKLVYDKLIKILTDQGVIKIEAVGNPFNVDYHEALLQKKAENVPPHTVLEEVETGYMYKDRVIRHSKVIVSDESSEELKDSDEKNK